MWASSSSVYGDAAAVPAPRGDDPTAPRSPYGVTKSALRGPGHRLRNARASTAGLRYFTFDGPRQRPDMAMCKPRGAARGASFAVYDDGAQSRDFTDVADAVDATFRRSADTART